MQLNRHDSTASHHPVLHKPNTTVPTLWSHKKQLKGTHTAKETALRVPASLKFQNLTTDEHFKYHPLKLYKNKAEEPLQMQQQPLFTAQIYHNS